MIKHFQEFAIFVVLIFDLYQVESVTADSSSCGDWHPFRDEKCFKILDTTTRSYADALKACQVLDGNPTLPIIESKEEQDFLVSYLFKTEKKVDNFWLGAKFSGTAFKWSDDTVLGYSNWDKDGPRNKVNYCLQIEADEAHLGKWMDEPCEKSNAVVCQKMQLWSSARLQKILLETRKELDKSNKETATLKHNNEESNKKIVEANTKIIEANSRISNLAQNKVPIGFIYVQLSSQHEARTLWPAMEWADVTSQYAGLFFRAEGGGAAQFGTIQPENAPRVTEVRHYTYSANDGNRHWDNTILNVGNWSSGIGVFAGSWDEVTGHTHRFLQSGGEIRPRNSAIRVWKRIN